MKKLLYVFFLIIVLAMSIFGAKYKDIERDNKDSAEIEEKEELAHGDIVIEHDPREDSNYEIKNIEKVSEFLDPAETQNYKDLITLYAAFVPEVMKHQPENYYSIDKTNIENILGFYKKDSFVEFYNKAKKSSVTTESTVMYIEIKEVKKDHNLLKAAVNIHYDTGILEEVHYINYVYIEGLPYLFIYHDV